ncbi:MAG: Crp/Fnr family transcriptional regulator [Saprospiraceae bacterium]|nr:Crp/Fnr family transcriptional regulator [Saprospiraceae bacterium]
MVIDYSILITYGGIARRFKKGTTVFFENNMPHFYYQILEGSVTVVSTNSEGKDLIQGIYQKGQCFGEPPLLSGRPYITTAITNTDSVIVRLGKENFLNILNDYPEITKTILYQLADKLYQKTYTSRLLVSHTPEEKITYFLNNYKSSAEKNQPVKIPYTRQQIANFTGLRVETVIRTLLKMKKEGKVKIINHKLFY